MNISGAASDETSTVCYKEIVEMHSLFLVTLV